jgi:periplasmic protein TonB
VVPSLPTTPRVRGWWESPRVLAIAGALALHLLLVTVADAITVLNPPPKDPPPPPEVELVEVDAPPPPPPPIVKLPEPEPAPTPEPQIAQPVPQHVAVREPPHEPPPPETPPSPDNGGGPVVTEDNIAPSATGVPVAIGERTTGHIGRGGHGTGSGTGSGAGSGSGDTPMSVATIKTRAMPKGDYAYVEEKDYPVEAKRLGIAGKIRVKLIVDDRGAVKSATLLNRLGHGLDEVALRRANLIEFEPAKDTDDHPVASVVVWTFDLTLPK